MFTMMDYIINMALSHCWLIFMLLWNDLNPVCVCGSSKNQSTHVWKNVTLWYLSNSFRLSLNKMGAHLPRVYTGFTVVQQEEVTSSILQATFPAILNRKLLELLMSP